MLPLGVLEQGMSLGSWSLAGCCEWSSGWWLWGRCLLDGSCWAGVSARSPSGAVPAMLPCSDPEHPTPGTAGVIGVRLGTTPGLGHPRGGSNLGASAAAGKGLGGESLFIAGPLCSECPHFT